MHRVIIVFISIFLLVIVWYLGYYWLFSNSNIYVTKTWWEYMIYEELTWDYSKTTEITNKIYYSLLEEDNIETYKWVWIFYDNPKKVSKDELRSKIWNILEKKDESKIEELGKKYSIEQIPMENYIVAEFPIRWKFSYILWMMKLYPKLNEYAKNNWYIKDSPVTEIYDIKNKKIIYRKQILKED